MIPRIFVHIPSYRDRECQWTVGDMFEKANKPERVFAGICWQSLPEEDADCFSVVTRPDQVREARFHIREARGLGWARQQAQALWQGEEYSLQIDSHMRFVPGWDDIMLQMLAACDAPEPVLTAYPPAYTPPDRLEPLPGPYVQCIKRFHPNGLLEFTCYPVPDGIKVDRPQATAACAGGFIFGPSRILRDVPSDPEIYFNGEEPNLAVRLWTAGFDLFSPHRDVIYHYYRRVESARHWNDFREANELHRRTMARMRALCQPEAAAPEDVAALGRYGLGNRRSLAEYEEFSGARFAGRTLADYARSFPFVKQRDKILDTDLVPTKGMHLFILGDEGLLFSETKGDFYRFNASATFAWCALEAGQTWPAIAQDLAERRGVSLPEAERELTSLAAHWLGHGLLRRPGDAPQAPRRMLPRFEEPYFKFRTRCYRLLGVPIQIRYGDIMLEDSIHPVIAHLESTIDEEPARTITLASIVGYNFLYCDDVQEAVEERLEAMAPKVKFTLLRCAIEKQSHMLQLHAGAVAKDGRLVLLLAPSGSGKTTLTARLVAAGFTYFSDEVVLLDRDNECIRPVPISLCVKESGTALLAPHFPGLDELPVYHRQDDIKVRYLPPPPHSLPGDEAGLPAAVIIFPRYVEGAPVSVRPLSSIAAFGRLMDDCVAIPKPLALTDAAALASFIESVRCYELTGEDLAANTVVDLLGAV